MWLFNNWIKMLERTFLLSYIDAGTGSLILQVIIGAAAGGLLALKLFWKRIKNWFTHQHSVKEKTEEGQEHQVEQKW
jgi:hypothetical protein